MEYVDIVDENGNFTGQVMEKEAAHDKNLLHNEISVFIINDENEILLQKRSANKRFNPNKWGLCSGHVDAGETLGAAALRELKEEIGIKFALDDIKPLGQRIINKAKTNSHIKYSYYVKRNIDIKDITIQKEELSKVKWFRIDDVIDMILAKDDSLTIKEDRLYLLEILKSLL